MRFSRSASNGCARSTSINVTLSPNCYNLGEMDAARRIRMHFTDSAELKLAAAEVMAPQIARAAALMTECLLADGKILACGNGGSAADAQHFAAEMVGRFERERPELPAISLSTDTSLLTAIANDYAFEQVFAKQVRAFGAKGIAVSGRRTTKADINTDSTIGVLGQAKTGTAPTSRAFEFICVARFYLGRRLWRAGLNQERNTVPGDGRLRTRRARPGPAVTGMFPQSERPTRTRTLGHAD